MRALVKDRAGPGLRLCEVPTPTPAAGEVLVRVLRAGVCGTDLHIYRWDAWAARTVRLPLVPGHEFVGEVVATAAGTGGLLAGQTVSAEGHLVCGDCRNCRAAAPHLCPRTRGLGILRDGVFADYAVLPATAIWQHRPGVDLDTAALFDPFGNAVHAAHTFPLRDKVVAITGAGPVGLMTIPVARHFGARAVVVVEPSPHRRRLAECQGATITCPDSADLAGALRDLGRCDGFDVGMEMSGHPMALTELLAHMSHGGRVVVLGLPDRPVPTDWADISLRMLTVQGVSGRRIFDTWHQVTALLDAGIRPAAVITHHFPADDYATAFEVATSTMAGKVMLVWSTEPRTGGRT
ncbi:L-threonine 3-dehydrogenase [Lentzea sp. BCCO 10_0798]|uniref:L-threonine 3-dehydrogenase n=1 Tax=Lentzea kristufekii TaxID=3095430 RepID=A0ABU4U1S0_9PSEU|nr:L-threonine 3-dehydrogenase [Lentzea sp. BCCO 10_0798]MDX8054360.1 L-threonine 3-dehydrogenase [Lentzea sp. BCCO 10_0798]